MTPTSDHTEAYHAEGHEARRSRVRLGEGRDVFPSFGAPCSAERGVHE